MRQTIGKKGLLDEHSVDNAVLTRSAYDTCFTNLGFDDGTLREKVPTHEVRVCSILVNGFDCDPAGFTVLWIGHICVLCTEHPDLLVCPHGADNFPAVLTNVRISRCTAYLASPLTPCIPDSATGFFPN